MFVEFTYSGGEKYKEQPRGVVCCSSTKYSDCAIKISSPEEIPYVLPGGVEWKELNVLFYPGETTRRVFGPQDKFTKEDFHFYLTSFKDDRDEPDFKEFYIHVWKERIVK